MRRLLGRVEMREWLLLILISIKIILLLLFRMGFSILKSIRRHNCTISSRVEVNLSFLRMWKKISYKLILIQTGSAIKKITTSKIQNYFSKPSDLKISFLDPFLKQMGSLKQNRTNGTYYGVHQTANPIYTRA